MSETQPKGPGIHRVASALQWRDYVRGEAQRCVIVCEKAGLTHFDIGARVGVHRTTVSLWRTKKVDLYAVPFEALKALAAEVAAEQGYRKVVG
jgi:hypothetical protein